jgi:hypothetical protein
VPRCPDYCTTYCVDVHKAAAALPDFDKKAAPPHAVSGGSLPARANWARPTLRNVNAACLSPG